MQLRCSNINTVKFILFLFFSGDLPAFILYILYQLCLDENSCNCECVFVCYSNL